MMKVVVLLLIIVGLASASNTTTTTSDPPIALPGCQDRCGNMSIPYPFGIGPNCFHPNSSFEMICNTTSQPPQLLLSNLSWHWLANAPFDTPYQTNITSIDVGTSTLSLYSYSSRILNDGTVNGSFPLVRLDMRGTPYRLMGGHKNSLVVVGCGGNAVLKNSLNETVVACSSLCEAAANSSNCQASIPASLDFFRIELGTTVISQGSNTSNPIKAFVADTSSYLQNYNITNQTALTGEFDYGKDVPTTLQWTVPDLAIDPPQYSNSSCALDPTLKGYTCSCIYEYYRGNPYLPNGCQVIKECEQCPKTCTSAVIGNSTSGYQCPSIPKKSPMPLVLGLGISMGTLLLSILLYGIYRWLKQRTEIRQKQNNFKKNGGLLLQQQLSAGEGVIERIKVYTSNELEKATDNFNENRIVGRGGQGTVYKGMLEDGTIVAIKRSKKVNRSSQLKQFINEVVILSQVNHRNVVQLFGCCLETEVPLLVYEYVINGTLSQNIHDPIEEFQLTWKMRLQIAIQSAEGLAYLHSSSYPPIYHKDIKTPNILLDDKYRAKVSDFGISKTIKIDQTHMTNTHVEGTFGYIDPEFYRSHQYTDKSDVYSFGVVLVELITSKKAVYEEKSLAINLASTFLDLKQNSRLYEIIDANVLEEAKKEELGGVADLAEQCLQMIGRQTPTMKEVVTKLLMITSQPPHVDISSPGEVSDENFDLIGNSISYASSEDPKYPLFSSTFSSSTGFGM